MSEDKNLLNKLIHSLINASKVNSNLHTPPSVVLWPDSESQWVAIIPELQKVLPHLIVLGDYDPEKKTGPAIWVKCMISGTLPEANWSKETVPVLYLPGISKSDLKQSAFGNTQLQPLAEYQYTGVIWPQGNGKEWTLTAYLQNKREGMGVSIAQDSTTREMLKKTLPIYFKDSEILFVRERVDHDYLSSIAFPEFIPVLLKWICKGDAYICSFNKDQQDIFKQICHLRFGFEADYKNIKEIVAKFASRKNDWEQVWNYYINSPHKYPKVETWLRSLTPPQSTLWGDEDEISAFPQINEEKENELCGQLKKIPEMSIVDAVKFLLELQNIHSVRLNWVWSEMDLSPLANSLNWLAQLAKRCSEPFPSATLEEIENYYVNSGYLCDLQMRKAFSCAKTESHREVVRNVIGVIYKPWLENLTLKYQKLIDNNTSLSKSDTPVDGSETFILFVDAFRYDVACEFLSSPPTNNYEYTIHHRRCALPSLTPTAKPAVSPVTEEISSTSSFNEFRPQFKNGKDVAQATFKEVLAQKGFTFVNNSNDINSAGRHWQETGEIDKKGHEEQSGMIRRIPECLEKIYEIISIAFEKGISEIKIVTDHGWLLLPGGLPKENMPADLTETRWGRCALLKDGVKSTLLHQSWKWNKDIYIAFAPGISFFKNNQEYAHGGISLQECIVPVITIKNKNYKNTNARITSVKWVNLRCTIETEGAPDGFLIDIRTKYTDSSTSVVLSPKKSVIANKCALAIDDGAESHSVAIVLMDQNGLIIDNKIGIVGKN